LSDSRLGKALLLIKNRGLRAGMRDALSAWAREATSVPPDVVGQYDIVLSPDVPARMQPAGAGPLRINWLIPELGKGSGGLFNIFRMIGHLEQMGHENRVYVLTNQPVDPAKASELIRNHYSPIKAKVQAFSHDIADSDALIATQWTTAYAARSVGNTARKFYFVQDLEHLFYAQGSLHEFAKQTYRFGFYGITAGDWIADVLRRDFGMECTPFGFSYEREWYSPQGERRFAAGKKRVLFYARATTERRGFELGVLALAQVAKRFPEVEVVLVGLRPREIDLPFPTVIPGHLSPLELAAVYRSCTAALVLSHTNLSLLPLEIMACGCPIVSNDGPNVRWLLSDEVAALADPVPEALANSLINLIDREDLRERMIAAGLAFTANTNWMAEASKIESALYSGLGLRREERNGNEDLRRSGR
jgi:glycosyltransferase involved in cell wall biosynthesis